MGRPTMIAIGAIGLYTETPLHCGAESATGYVDLPVQRERHTGYPLIPGSTIKGVLRDEMKSDERLGKDGVRDIFGADSTDEKAPSPGIVSFGDGLLVAFPVRSSGAPFHWVTCPFVLERVFRALGATDVEVKQPKEKTAWAKSGGRYCSKRSGWRRRRTRPSSTTAKTRASGGCSGSSRRRTGDSSTRARSSRSGC